MLRTFLEDWIGSLDLANLRLGGFPSRVLLCGGAIEPQEIRPSSSGRDSFHRHLSRDYPDLLRNVVLAETVVAKWMDAARTFPDLLSLEERIGHLVAHTLLFVESPGSIAELGSFAVIAEISKALIVVTDTSAETEKSFIRLGPIERIHRANAKNVVYYPLKRPPSAVSRMESEDCEHLASMLKGRLAVPRRVEPLQRDRPRHQMWLIPSLLNMLPALQEGELLSGVKALGVTIELSELRRHLLALQILGIISRASYGNDLFYVSRAPEARLLCNFKATIRDRSMDAWATAYEKEFLKSTGRLNVSRGRAYATFMLGVSGMKP